MAEVLLFQRAGGGSATVGCGLGSYTRTL